MFLQVVFCRNKSGVHTGLRFYFGYGSLFDGGLALAPIIATKANPPFLMRHKAVI